MTLNGVIALILRFFSNSIALQTDNVTVEHILVITPQNVSSAACSILHHGLSHLLAFCAVQCYFDWCNTPTGMCMLLIGAQKCTYDDDDDTTRNSLLVQVAPCHIKRLVRYNKICH